MTEGAMCGRTEDGFAGERILLPSDVAEQRASGVGGSAAEIFGPVLAAMTFQTPSEAVELGNNTAYGLAASVWTRA